MPEPINDPLKAFLRTWEKWFAPRIVKSPWPPYSKLYYYKPDTTFADNQKSLFGLLVSAKKTGQCSAWVALLRYVAVSLNDAQWKMTEVKPIEGYTHFLVKRWIDERVEDWGLNKWWFRFGGKDRDMVAPSPSPDPLIYGDVTNNLSGIPGQNSASVVPCQDCPSQKMFERHYIFHLLLDNNFYDPSYGEVYTDEDDFKRKALFALAKDRGIDKVAGKLTFELDNTKEGRWVTFRDL